MSLRAGHALADLQLGVLGVSDAAYAQRRARRRGGLADGRGARARRPAGRGAHAPAADRSSAPCRSCCRRACSTVAGRHGRNLWCCGGPPGADGTERCRHASTSHGSCCESIENAEHDRCVDLFRRPDGSFGFEAVPPRRRGWRPLDGGCVPFRRRLCLEGGGRGGSRRRGELARAALKCRGEKDLTEDSRGARSRRTASRSSTRPRATRAIPRCCWSWGWARSSPSGPNSLFQGLAQKRLLRHPLRQPRHRPVHRLRQVGPGQHSGGARRRR